MKIRLLASLLAAVTALAALGALPVGAYWKSDGFRYTIDKGEATILGYYGESPDVVIPSEFDGYPVTAIGSRAFEEEPITSLVIPDSVREIGSYAFMWCDLLTRVTIPPSLKSVSFSAFENCRALKRVDISDLAAWCAIFWGGTQTNPLSYAHNLYLNEKLVTNLVIPDGVTEIGGSAFEGCTSITSVSFPDGLNVIGSCAFMGCASLTYVSIPDGVTVIGDGAFCVCASLAGVTLPASVTKIFIDPFGSCPKLKSIRYAGSEEDWNKILFDEYDYNTKNLNVEFNYVPPAAGDVNGDGKHNSKDVIAMLRLLVGYANGEIHPGAADFDGNGRINSKDVIALMKAIVSQA